MIMGGGAAIKQYDKGHEKSKHRTLWKVEEAHLEYSGI